MDKKNFFEVIFVAFVHRWITSCGNYAEYTKENLYLIFLLFFALCNIFFDYFCGFTFMSCIYTFKVLENKNYLIYFKI